VNARTRPVRRRRHREDSIGIHEEAQQQPRSPARKQESGRAADERQQHALDQQLLHDAAHGWRRWPAGWRPSRWAAWSPARAGGWATLAHAISSTMPTMPISAHSGRRQLAPADLICLRPPASRQACLEGTSIGWSRTAREERPGLAAASVSQPRTNRNGCRPVCACVGVRRPGRRPSETRFSHRVRRSSSAVAKGPPTINGASPNRHEHLSRGCRGWCRGKADWRDAK